VVLHSFQKYESHGLDGWSVEIFLWFYDLYEEDLLRVIEESRVSGRILVSDDTTFIVLFPNFTIHTDLRNTNLFPCEIPSIKLSQI
jgi:hypothetical protein